VSDKQQEQKITVKSDTLANLIVNVGNGKYRVPQFQREFVWTKSKIIELFDSIYHEWPIGSLFLWEAERENNHLFRQIVDLGVRPVGEYDTISFILDGQQRITSLYVTLKGLTANGVDYSRIAFDLKDHKFTDRKSDNKRYVAVCDLWGPDALKLARQIDEDYVTAYEQCWRTLQTYPVSLVEVRDKDLPAVCKIFQRINQSGKRLDRFDLIAAMTFTTSFDLRVKFKSDILTRLDQSRFGAISPAIVTQLLALIKNGQCTERHEFGLKTDDITKNWGSATAAILLAADTLRKNMGVVNAAFLPYDAILTLLSYYFAKSGQRALPPEHMEWVRTWFWRSAFGQRYGAGGATRLGQDRELFDGLIEGRLPTFTVPIQLNPASLVKVRMTQSGSALRNAFLCLLAFRGPLHLINNTPLDLVTGGISDFTSPEKHHVFPRAFLERSGPAGADVHSLPNFCFIPAELNKRISDADPAQYFTAFQVKNPRLDEALQSHLLPTGSGSGIYENDYLRFLSTRSSLIVDEIRRLCGEITTPRDDERPDAVNQLETRLRDCIDLVLTNAASGNYWRTNIPPAVRDNAEKRIKEAIDKYPELLETEFAVSRKRLDYCNVMDYKTIIENGLNWPMFESIFRRKQDFQSYLANFSEYRNSVMHNRKMTELEEKNGEAALLWLSGVLPGDDESFNEGPTEDAGENDAVSEQAAVVSEKVQNVLSSDNLNTGLGGVADERSEMPHEAGWSGYWFVNVGDGDHRSWDDCVKYGFLSAGQGKIYSEAMKKLKVGDKIFAYLKGSGYVGFGCVTQEAVMATDFKVNGQSLFDLPLVQAGIKNNADNPELSEWPIAIKWIKTYPRDQARTFTGIFANPNIVCKLRDEQTVKFVKREFGIEEE
jgi:hypothetical protein